MKRERKRNVVKSDVLRSNHQFPVRLISTARKFQTQVTAGNAQCPNGFTEMILPLETGFLKDLRDQKVSKALI